MTTNVASTSKLKKDISYQDVADYFLAISKASGEPITNLKLQKLVYYAQAWFLANKSTPLFKEHFEAWVHGPVIPQLYEQYKTFGSSPIQSDVDINEVKSRFDEDKLELLDEVTKIYMPKGAYELELMTHQEDPWVITRGALDPDQHSNAVISEELMRSFYGARLQS